MLSETRQHLRHDDVLIARLPSDSHHNNTLCVDHPQQTRLRELCLSIAATLYESENTISVPSCLF